MLNLIKLNGIKPRKCRIYLFIMEGEYGTDSNFESEWSDSQSEMEVYWSDDVLSDNKPRSSLWGKRMHKKNCFFEELFSVTIKVHDCTLINLALNKKSISVIVVGIVRGINFCN